MHAVKRFSPSTSRWKTRACRRKKVEDMPYALVMSRVDSVDYAQPSMASRSSSRASRASTARAMTAGNRRSHSRNPYRSRDARTVGKTAVTLLVFSTLLVVAARPSCGS
jgi:hypothetical protein